jgi:glutathione peroxidase
MLQHIQELAMVFARKCGLISTATQSRPDTVMENPSKKSFYDFTLTSLDGREEISFERYKGKKVLLVNVASKCGLTPQYKGLQSLHEQYSDKLAILGFPANNFLGQEPAGNGEIAEFCERNYGVSFQMFTKISVKGDDQHPLYQWLSSKEQNGWNTKVPDWNFAKYLIDEQGKLVKFFPSSVLPLSQEIQEAIKA